MPSVYVNVDYCMEYQDGYSISTEFMDDSVGLVYEHEGQQLIWCSLCEENVPGYEHFVTHTHGRTCDSGIAVKVDGEVKVETKKDPYAGVEICIVDCICTECGLELDARDPDCKHFCHDLV